VVTPPGPPAAGPAARPQLLPLSAADPAALDEATDRLISRLDSGPALADVARDLQAEWPARPFRRVVVATEAAEAADYLRRRDRRRVFSAAPDAPRPVVFMFSGVGDRYPGLAAGLYRCWPAFRQELDRCFRLLGPHLGVDLHAVLYPEGTGQPAAAAQGRPDKAAMFDQRRSPEEVHGTAVAQPLIFAVQQAMATTLRSLGVEPSALLGYSVGEYVAACQAGVLPLDSALRLVALRARLIADLPEGAMLAVMAPAAAAEPHCAGRLSVAAVDGPQLTVLAGRPEDIRQAAERLTGAGIACRQLPTSHAFHSFMMDPVVQPLHDLLTTFALRTPGLPVLSNATGTWLSPDQATSPGYWAGHVRETVRFADELAEVWKLPDPILVELGPGRALGQLAGQVYPRPTRPPDSARPARPVDSGRSPGPARPSRPRSPAPHTAYAPWSVRGPR
jgi:acyl transferase domain-containing protein